MGTLHHIKWALPALMVLALGACEPQVTSAPDLESAPTSESVTFEYEPDADNPNVIHFTNTSDNSFKALWDFGNGSTDEGDEVIGEFPQEGEYTVTLTIFSESGQAKNTKNISIAETNALMLDDPDLNLLTGGADNVDGKTWVIDSTQIAHMGVGPPEGSGPEWWSAPAMDKQGKGLYDDEFTFSLDGFSYEQQTNGYVYVNTNYPDEFAGAVQEDGGADYIAPFEGGSDFNFVLKEEEGKMLLEITGGGHIGYYSGSRTYEILALSENELYIRNLNASGSEAWYQRLIPKGYEHPPEILPYESEALEDNFDEEGNVSWATDQITNFNESYDNPAPTVADTTNKVAKYAKGEGQFENVYIDLGYELNLNERSTIRLKAYLPSYNDYETVDPNAQAWAPGNLLQQVEVKLHNVNGETGLGGNAWQTQETIIKQVSETGTWVDLEFDFSGVSDREDFDRIVIQIGGEGHGMPGTFFIDDFELVE